MAQWYVNKLSKLTGVSVQTLHHYDRIGLLKPSLRLSNGYRLYSERDLLHLQQIIALKFFGFELSKIKEILSNNASAIKHFKVQERLLSQKAQHLLEASALLKDIISEDQQTIPWKDIIKLIEVYSMTQNIEHSWVKEIFTHEELKQYADFTNELKSKYTLEQETSFEKTWANLVDEMRHNLATDPASSIGITLGKKCMDWLNKVYGRKYAHLRTKMMEKGFAEGKGLVALGLTPEIVSWMDKAVNAYWRDRIAGILVNVGNGVSDDVIFQLWNEALDEMYGEDDSRKKEIYNIVLADKDASPKAKEWLKTLKKT